MKPARGSFGFTLAEIIIVLTAIGILTALTTPSFSNRIEKRRLIGAAEPNQSAIAPNDAVKRVKPIYVTIAANVRPSPAREGGADGSDDNGARTP